MDRKLIVICVLAVTFAALIISGCTSAPVSPTATPSPMAPTMPAAAPNETYAGEGGFAENASINATVTPVAGEAMDIVNNMTTAGEAIDFMNNTTMAGEAMDDMNNTTTAIVANNTTAMT
jgi:hypothetical protein